MFSPTERATLKTRRFATTVALTSALALSLTGCGFFTPIATLEQYAPSDGIDITIETVKVRNLMLITNEAAKEFNVVFTGVNTGDTTKTVRMTFVGENGSALASADFALEPGINVFGLPDGEVPQTLVTMNGPKPGDTVTVFVEAEGLGEDERQAPVLDGTLPEYKDLVP